MSDKCNNCGLCCMGMTTPPIMPEDERRMTPQLRKVTDDWVSSPRRLIAGDGSPCCWLDLLTGRCRYYDQRPGICREFRVGCKSCNEYRKAAGLEPIRKGGRE